MRKREHAEHPNAVVQWQSDDAAGTDLVARLGDAAAVDADVPGFDQRLGERAAFDQADAMKETVDPHFFFNFASSAKA